MLACCENKCCPFKFNARLNKYELINATTNTALNYDISKIMSTLTTTHNTVTSSIKNYVFTTSESRSFYKHNTSSILTIKNTLSNNYYNNILNINNTIFSTKLFPNTYNSFNKQNNSLVSTTKKTFSNNYYNYILNINNTISLTTLFPATKSFLNKYIISSMSTRLTNTTNTTMIPFIVTDNINTQSIILPNNTIKFHIYL